MTDENRPVHKHKRKAREHLTNLERQRKEAQQFAAEHLANSPQPVKDEPARE